MHFVTKEVAKFLAMTVLPSGSSSLLCLQTWQFRMAAGQLVMGDKAAPRECMKHSSISHMEQSSLWENQPLMVGKGAGPSCNFTWTYRTVGRIEEPKANQPLLS
jgi:hypothetical protein